MNVFEKIDFAAEVTAWMTGKKHTFLKDFDREFVPITTDGDMLYGEVVDNRVSFVTPTVIMNHIYAALEKESDLVKKVNNKFKGYGISMSTIKNFIFPHWESVTKSVALNDIKTIGFEDDGLCFERWPWTFEQVTCNFDAQCPPIYEELLCRVSNADAMCMFFGSLFDPASDRQQYLYIYGSGQNGKGSIARVFQKVLGRAFRSEVPPSKNGGSQFWTSGLINVRLACFFDCNNNKFPRTGVFKSLTGGDPIRIERKNKQAYTTEIETKFMFLSNNLPDLSGEKADMRRAIYCQFLPTEVIPDPNYETRLAKDALQFVQYCYNLYERTVSRPMLATIPVDNEELSMIVEENELEYSSVLDDYFEVDHESSQYLTGKGFHAALENLARVKNDRKYLSSNWIGDFKKFIARRDVTIVRKRLNGKRIVVYLGLSVKPSADFMFTDKHGDRYVRSSIFAELAPSKTQYDA